MIQPTTPIRIAAKMFGSMSSITPVMFDSGSIKPSICSAATMAGRNSSNTSQ